VRFVRSKLRCHALLWRVLLKIFGAMANDSYLEISSHFGVYPLEQSIALRGDKFLKKVQFVGQLFMSADSQTLA